MRKFDFIKAKEENYLILCKLKQVSQAVENLVERSQVDAVAVVGCFPDEVKGCWMLPKPLLNLICFQIVLCVLAGLSNAPQHLVRNPEASAKGCIMASDVDSVILQIDACGGEGALAFARSKRSKPLIICVEENETVLNDTADKLGIKVIKVKNYWEAVGVIAAHKAGIGPNSLRRNRIRNICHSSVVQANGFVISTALSII
ncbi:U-box domain-containing protein 10-like [Hibiscus syriacus]|uniref:U-box domain-containing protein 10-like n=1 Tax=Hibiscus syriacus TaxID=106335 RepID=A0A6A3AW49_HIBSY|nr:U-box domain-containing protein 10-like [Hibiscus syriacus]